MPVKWFPSKKYQVFVSSTYKDLASQRSMAIQEIMNCGYISAGMEMFSCTRNAWTVIQDSMRESDYFLLLVARCYGTKDKASGVSFTEREYLYARELGLPVIAVFLEESAAWEGLEDANRTDVNAFRERVKDNTNPHYWKDDESLKLKICTQLNHVVASKRGTGWIRGWSLWAMIGTLLATISSSALWSLVCLIFGLPWYLGSRGVVLHGPWAAAWGAATCLPVIGVALLLRIGQLRTKEYIWLIITYTGLGSLGGLTFYNTPVREWIERTSLPSIGKEVIIITCWSSILASSSGLALLIKRISGRAFDPRAFVRHWLGAVSLCFGAIFYFLLIGWREPNGAQFIPLRGFLAHTAVTTGMFWGLVWSFRES
jgi:hypothetical protein